MDAISDVSRASQIFSSVPRSHPLPDPLDLDELLGFNEALGRRRGLDEEVVDSKYLGKSKIFINHVDSFIGKHLVSVLAHRKSEVVNVEERHPPVVNELLDGADSKEVDKKSPRGGRSDGRKEKSPAKLKGKKEKSPSPQRGKNKAGKINSSFPNKVLAIPLEESLEDIQDQEKPLYDSSKLTVAEYYEMMDLKPGLERDTYLKDKLKRYLNKSSPPAKKTNKNHSSSKRVFNEDFEIIGTLKSKKDPQDVVPRGVSKIIHYSEENQLFVKHLSKCSVIIYNITEDSDQVIEATYVLNDLQNLLRENENYEESNEPCTPFIILLSTFMTWSLTKPLNSKQPDLPLIEKDYRKRKPHPNYQWHFDLEEQVIKMNGDMDTVVLICGIPYGHEENVLCYLFKMAFSCLDLPIFNSGNNTLPVIHVENIGQVIKEVLKRRNMLSSPIIFAKDPVAYSMKDLVKAISANLGTGCYRMMPSVFSFLNDEITQDIYDQTTADVNLESCYPLFSKEDLIWKYEDGFVENIKTIVKEFVDANQIKPLCILFYGLGDEMESAVLSKLSVHFRLPQLRLSTVVEEYIYEIEEKIKIMEDVKAAAAMTQRGSLKSQKTLIESKSITGLQECQDDSDLQSSLDFIKNLNLKSLADFKNLTDTQNVSILQLKLRKDSCLNNGFLLVDFPKTLNQAKLLFPKTNINDVSIEKNENFRGNTKPDFIVYISKSEHVKQSVNLDLFQNNVKTSSFDEISASKMCAYPELESANTTLRESTLSPDHHDLTFDLPLENATDTKVQGETTYISKNTLKYLQEIPVIKYILDNNESCKLIKLETHDSDDADRIYVNVIKEIEVFQHGEPRNLVDLNISREDTLYYPEDTKKQSKLKEKKNFIVDERIFKASFLEETEYKKCKEEEESILAMNSCALLKYLIRYVFPTLTNAILEVAALQPDDPLDFIAEYLFVNNPEGHMMNPTEETQQQDLMNKPQGAMKVDSKACLA